MAQPPSLLARVIGLLLGAVFLVLAFVFSIVIFIVLLAVGLLALGYLWWKSRALRRTRGPVIIESTGHYDVKDEAPALEGESRRVEDEK